MPRLHAARLRASRCVVLAAAVCEGCDVPAAGAFAKSGKQVVLGCSDGGLQLVQVKPDGKRAMDAERVGRGPAGEKRRLGEALVTKLASARKAALRVLVDAERSGTYARDAFNVDAGVQALDARDRGLALRLTLGL